MSRNVDLPKILQKYNSQLGEYQGKVIILEAEIESLQGYITELEQRIAAFEEEKATQNGKAPASNNRVKKAE